MQAAATVVRRTQNAMNMDQIPAAYRGCGSRFLSPAALPRAGGFQAGLPLSTAAVAGRKSPPRIIAAGCGGGRFDTLGLHPPPDPRQADAGGA